MTVDIGRQRLADFLVREARAFAIGAHSGAGNRRKYTNIPYWTHPHEVVELLAYNAEHCSPQMLAAAWLHDVVEDANIPLGMIRDEFGPVVGEYVFWLTDVSKPHDGNRAARKALDRAHIAKAPPAVKTIKLADLISNSHSIAKHDPKFAQVYLPEKALLMHVLRDGDKRMWQMADELLTRLVTPTK